jgi:hypothetical protein
MVPTAMAPSAAITANVANTVAGSDAPRIRPAQSGPSAIPRLSTKPETTLAAVRSCGVRVMLGSSDACTGRVNVRLTA